ncbi:sulfate transporter [Mycobacterium noviomagense]|uniref:Sulfate transporter n=1 Tax=Mycobacterium noviomagense TaxID=459858 RepID=A0A7I7PA78_9MYCO|nr:STAS domain-containing protein [Mycobacterium noviomagense]ORB15864.1 sulfate transporter [Mycobacterium noviomagense]BBY05491.1 sulfate transporter [Mycobacterium noviomagense]
MSRPTSQLTIYAARIAEVRLLTVDGVLNSSTYLKLRDTVIKAALDEPRAVIVDVTMLDVPASSAWSVFTSARWHVSTWPDVPIMLVCGHARGRRTIARGGVARYVPVYATIDAALEAAADSDRFNRRRTRAELPGLATSLRQARELVAEWLGAWSQSALIPVATVIVNVFVENVLQHTASAPVVVLESDGTTVSVAVQDNSPAPAVRSEDSLHGRAVHGLAIVAAVSRAWGSTPMPSGKTVWAVVGPENQL